MVHSFLAHRSPASYAVLLCGAVLAPCGGTACGEVRADAVVLGPTIASGGASSEDTSTAGRSDGDGDGDGGDYDDPDAGSDLEAPSIAGDLCSPCTRSSECGGYKDYCLEFRDSDDRFCGEHCHSDEDCPDGYECVTLRNDSDEEQCVPEDRQCPGDSR